MLKASGDAEATKAVGSAEAFSIKAIGEAEANAMKARAAAYKDYGDAAIISLVIDTLPKIAAEIAAPLAQTKEIVVVGDGAAGTSDDITKLVSQLPPKVQALTGVDLTKVDPMDLFCPSCLPEKKMENQLE